MNDTAAFPPRIELRCGPVTAVDLALFAAASGDHNPLHLDSEVARAAGFDRPVVHGMLTCAYAARLFTQQFGAGCVRRLRTRFSGVALLGDTLHLSAELTKVESGVAHYTLNVRTTAAAAGAEQRDVATGQAQVARTIGA